MLTDKWVSAYVDGKPSKSFSYRKRGVYLIRNRHSGKITYIGMSISCLYKALYRHFHVWNYPYRVTYVDDKDSYEVRVVILPREWVEYFEIRLIRYFLPPDNRNMYEDVDLASYRPFGDYSDLEDSTVVVDNLPF